MPDYERLLEQPFQHLIPGHGEPLLWNAKPAIRASMAWTFDPKRRRGDGCLRVSRYAALVVLAVAVAFFFNLAFLR